MERKDDKCPLLITLLPPCGERYANLERTSMMLVVVEGCPWRS